MAQFMLILHGAPNSLDKLSPTEIQSIIEKYGAWTGKMAAAGKLVSGQKLMDEGGKALSKSGDRLTVVDGPYSETKEVVGGYSVIEADTIDEAVEVARTWPGVDRGWITMEVRPVWDMS